MEYPGSPETVTREVRGRSWARRGKAVLLAAALAAAGGVVGNPGLHANLFSRARVRGILFPDISAWQTVHDWDALARASHGIVAIKVREYHVDPKFHRDLHQAERRGMIVIGYDFAHGGSGRAQADAFLKVFPIKPGRIAMLDFERNPDGRSMTIHEAAAFAKRIHERTGRYPILYGSMFMRTPGVLAKCPRYIPVYLSHGAHPPKGADIWQFTDGVYGPGPHRFPGVGHCDINKLLVPFSTVLRWAGLEPKAELLALKNP